MKKSNKKKRYCISCGDKIADYTSGSLCQSCRTYLSKHPEGTYIIPGYGEVAYAFNGDPICHICGQAHRKLGNHIAFKHHMSQKDYRDMFGLYRNTKLSNEDYIAHMSILNDKYKDVVVKKNLIEKGVKTRMTTELSQSLEHRKYGEPVKKIYAHIDN